jgi:hypothetical protein
MFTAADISGSGRISTTVKLHFMFEKGTIFIYRKFMVIYNNLFWRNELLFTFILSWRNTMFYQWVKCGYGQSIAVVLNRRAAHFCIARFCQVNRETLERRIIVQNKILQSDSMEFSPCWETTSFLVTEELPNILWNPKIHRCFYKSPPLVPTLSQINPVYISAAYFSKTEFNITIPPTSRLS